MLERKGEIIIAAETAAEKHQQQHQQAALEERDKKEVNKKRIPMQKSKKEKGDCGCWLGRTSTSSSYPTPPIVPLRLFSLLLFPLSLLPVHLSSLSLISISSLHACIIYTTKPNPKHISLSFPLQYMVMDPITSLTLYQLVTSPSLGLRVKIAHCCYTCLQIKQPQHLDQISIHISSSFVIKRHFFSPNMTQSMYLRS